jgi:hypothetical protein
VKKSPSWQPCELATIDNHFLAIGAKSLYRVIQIGIRAPISFLLKKKYGKPYIVVFNDIRAVIVIFNMLVQIIHTNS